MLSSNVNMRPSVRKHCRRNKNPDRRTVHAMTYARDMYIKLTAPGLSVNNFKTGIEIGILGYAFARITDASETATSTFRNWHRRWSSAFRRSQLAEQLLALTSNKNLPCGRLRMLGTSSPSEGVFCGGVIPRW